LAAAGALKSLPGYCCSRYRFASHWFAGHWFGSHWFGSHWFGSQLLAAGFGGLPLPMNQFGGLPLPMNQFAGCLTSMPELGGRKAQQRPLLSLSADLIYANSFP
jgi:hypothetical protein